MAKNFIIPIGSGLHLWEMAEFTRIANQFNCRVYIRKNGLTANAKKIGEIIALNETRGAELEVILNGDDEEAATQSIQKFAVNVFEGGSPPHVMKKL